MKAKFALLTIFFLFVISVNVAFALTDPIWVVGKISTSTSEVMYETTSYWTFNLTIAESNGTLTLGMDITCIAEKQVMQPPTEGVFYNFSGRLNDVQTNEIPANIFIIEKVNSQTFENDWIFYFTQIVNIISGVTAQIVNTIVELIKVGVGYDVPPMIVTLIIVGLCFYFLVKHYKSIGLLLILVMGFLVVSGFANMLRLVVT